MLSIIVAISQNNIIGCNNSLLWHIPEDLKIFKAITENHKIIMGRKTFQSLPKILSNRQHIVLSKDKNFKFIHKDVNIINNLNEIVNNYVNCNEEVFVIGGGEIYKKLLCYTDKLYISKIKKDFTGNVLFPKLDSNNWDLYYEKNNIYDVKSKLYFDFMIYTRIKK